MVNRKYATEELEDEEFTFPIDSWTKPVPFTQEMWEDFKRSTKLNGVQDISGVSSKQIKFFLLF